MLQLPLLRAGLLLAWVPAALSALGGSVPAGLRSTFMFGSQSFPGGAGSRAWMDATKLSHNAQWDIRYTYLNAGVNTGFGWETWNAPSGQYAALYMSDSDGGNYIPAFTYYEMLQSTPASGADESAKDYNNLNNPATMAAYYANFKLLMQKCAAFNKTVIVHLEPDLNGYIQKDHSGSPALPQNCPAAVASSGFVEAAGYPNNYQGYHRVLRRLRDLYAPKVLLAEHVTMWASGQDLMASTLLSQAQLDAELAKTAAFLNACDSGAEGKYDLFFFEASDRDSSYKWIVNGNTGYWWSSSAGNISGSPLTFARHVYLVDGFSSALGKRGMAWQIPVGNSVFKTCNNDLSGYHWRSPYAEYVLGDYAGPGPASHVKSYADAGVVGWLFGAGQADQTHPWDERGDGITNPANAANGGGPGYGTITATVADDDGGYLRIFTGRYYTLGAWPLSGALTPTPSATVTPLQSPTVTRTPTPSPTPSASPTAIAYSLIFEDFEAGPIKYGYSYADSMGSSISPALSAVSPYDGGTSVRDSLTVVAGGYAGHGFDSNYANAQGVINATGCYLVQVALRSDQAVSLVLQFKEAGTAASPVAGGDGELWDSPQIDVPAGPGWTLFTLSLSGWTEDLYSSNGAAGDGLMDLSAMKTCQLNFLPGAAGATLNLDHIAFIPLVPPTPSPTRTPTRTPSGTPSATPTASPSPSASPTRTPSPTGTASASPSATATASPSFSPSSTRTASPTASLTHTASPFASATETPTPTRSATLSATLTATLSATPVLSSTPTPTGTLSLTDPPTALGTFSATPTGTVTLTASPSWSANPSATGTPSWTGSPSPSNSATATLSGTPTLSWTVGASATLTATPALSGTPTPSPAPTAAATPSATAGPSPTPTATAALPPTAGPGGSDGLPELGRPTLWPNPGPRTLHADYKGRLLDWRLELYSRSMQKLGELQGPAPATSPLRVDLAALGLRDWAAGAYHYQLRLRFADRTLSRAGTCLVLH